MSEENDYEDDLARILKQAGPRPMPSEEAVSAARSAVRDAWQLTLRRRRRQRAFMGGAIAASLLLAVTLLVLPPPDAAQVARVDKLDGSLYVSRDAGELERASDLATLHAGQSLRTGRDSVAGLVLASGASLRVAPDTSLVFVGEGEVELLSGSVYVDSAPNVLADVSAAGSSALRIRTRLGSVTHVGTQYIVVLDDERLYVRVREGEVRLDESMRARAGEQLSTDGLGVDRISIAGHGPAWQWAESVSPTIDVDQQTAEAFLRWVAHETGFSIAYADDATADNAGTTILTGSIDAAPREALAAWTLAADYTYELDELNGIIRIGRR